MAKRRKLETPSAEALSRIEEEFRSETVSRSGVAPIAQVAAEAASETEVLGAETRAKLAEADVFREAREKGLVLAEIPIDRIHAEELVRDRAVVDREELNELRSSILQNGMRLPIEVFELPQKTEAHDYGLISGYRRLLAMREAATVTEAARFQTIKAIIRTPETSAESVAAMVEENEVRADLSHFERGRIAVLAAQNGTFVNVEEAVDRLFAFASRAKRSKIRSFAMIFEELGDLLEFPDLLTERQGLRLAAALRAGGEGEMRAALALSEAATPEEEWAQVNTFIEAQEAVPKDRHRGGRPAEATASARRRNMVETPRGVVIEWSKMKRGYSVQLKGDIDPEEIAYLVGVMKERLE
ncbi:MAG: ParB N-terminal domain-containing protein [Silicimonas sp.]|nr:ParB N-terminal domain-containing protein [Silicimonas sp.]